MKKLLFIVGMVVAIAAYAQEPKHERCASTACGNQCDSINMPVFIVDGVEVQNKIFSPRLGGVVLITTESKKFLTPILEDFNRRSKEQRQQRIPGELYIR